MLYSMEMEEIEWVFINCDYCQTEIRVVAMFAHAEEARICLKCSTKGITELLERGKKIEFSPEEWEEYLQTKKEIEQEEFEKESNEL
jgi:hypothetical protein